MLAAALAVRADVAEPARAARPRARGSSTRPGCTRIKEGPERRAATLLERGHRRAQHAPHRLERRPGRAVPPLRPARVRLGHAVRPRCSRPALRMGLDGIYSDWVDRMMDAYRAELGGSSRCERARPALEPGPVADRPDDDEGAADEEVVRHRAERRGCRSTCRDGRRGRTPSSSGTDRSRPGRRHSRRGPGSPGRGTARSAAGRR